jgi:2-polyprenyl-6-methoxyphenol hydroxylase-like FAD-dependent oxidoreductase
LLLGNAGIKVEILEAANQLDESPRATFYSYPALYELKRAGLLDEIRERGYIPPGSISWRKVDKTLLARTNGDAIPLDYQLHCLPLGELCKLVEEHLSRNPNVEIRYLHKVVELDQSEGHARVTVDAPDGRKTLEADYIVGCDGANSQIRRSLFGDHEFPGRTWDEQIVATNVSYTLFQMAINADRLGIL